MKKVLALVLAFAMMFSTITVAFAEPEVSAEAKALATVGMLEGDGNGVTAEYTAKEMTRFTAAISLLKLKGLYNDALAFKADANFADVDAVKWEEGKNILAYLKANPGLGFGGNEKGEFNPNGNINEQSYYKVLLETLGYKQTTAEVAGDFAWEEVLTFAESIGLKPAKAEKFTVDELAKATVAALKAEMKDGKVLINVLVESGKVDKAKAVAAELMPDAPAVAVESAKAMGNTTVKVTFDGDVNSAVENVELYAVEGLEVKSAAVYGKDSVLLETDAQTSGKLYTLVVGEVKVNFTGIAKVSGAPELKTAKGADTGLVDLTFDKVLDASALDVANYSIAGATVESAEFDSAMKVVTLNVTGLTARKSYTVKVTNIESVDGGVLKSGSKPFVAVSDTVAPKMSKIVADTYTRFKIEFNEYVTKESVEDVANYTVKSGSTELEVLKVEDITTDDDDYTIAEVTTAPQKAIRYEVSANNLVDDSVLANKMTKASKLSFTGKNQDKTLPKFKSYEYVSRNNVVVTFDEASRLDQATAFDPNNYTFNEDVAVEKVEQLPGTKADFKSVLLTVSEISLNKSYKLTVEGVEDEYGNVMKKATPGAKRVSADNLAVASVTSVKAISSTKVEIKFSKYLNADTAKALGNYTVNNDIGNPSAVKYEADKNKVTLTLAEMVAGKTYKVTLNNVQDIAGNNVKAVDVKFVGYTSENDIDAPTIEYVEALNKNVVRIEFDETISNPTSATLVIKEFKGFDSDGNAITGTTAKTLNAKIGYESDTIVEFSGVTFTDEKEYVITSLDAKDKAGNAYKAALDSDAITFYATTADVEAPELLSVTQVSAKKFELTFSEKVQKVGAFDGLTSGVDADDETIGYLTSTRILEYGKEYEDSIGDAFKNYHGTKIANWEDDGKKTIIVVDLDDQEAPYIENVEAIDRKTIEVTFNEDIEKAGSYEIEYYNDKDKEVTISPTSMKSSIDDNVVTLTLNTATLESKYTYTLRVTKSAYDVANNSADNVDEEYSFTGSDIRPIDNYIIGVEFVNGMEIKAKLFKALGSLTSADVTLENEDEVDIEAGVAPIAAPATTSATVTITTSEPLRSDETYTLTIDGISGSFTFDGIVEDDLTVDYDDNETTTPITDDNYVFTYSDMVKDDHKVYASVYNIDGSGQLGGTASISQTVAGTVDEPACEIAAVDGGLGRVILSAYVRHDVDGIVLYTYTDADLEEVIEAVLAAYEARAELLADPTNVELIDAEEEAEDAAVSAILGYDGVSRTQLLELLDDPEAEEPALN